MEREDQGPAVSGLIWKSVAVVVVLLALVLFIGTCSGGWAKPGPGEISVVRNGGPFDNHRIRQIIPNGSGNTWTGLFSSTHKYPVESQQRFFRMETCYSGGEPEPCEGADTLAVTVPTADGVNVTIEGTFYLNTVFGDPRYDPTDTKCPTKVGGGTGDCVLKAFDTQFGTRTFGGKHPYDGLAGMEKFLAANAQPVVVNNLRATIATVTCADLVSSCALVQNQGDIATKTIQRKAQDGANQANIASIERSVEEGLDRDLIDTLGSGTTRYFKNIKFSLQRVELPARVQEAVDAAQSSFAAVSQAQAKLQSADLEAQANERRQAGYDHCPACARIDAIRALPPGLTALGGNFAVGVK